MSDYEVDVVVVGAGPGGSICARDLARQGLKVMVFDKKQEIGTPKRCAEGLAKDHFRNIGVEPSPKWAPQLITSTLLTTPSGKEVLIEPNEAQGYVLERKVFEKHLAAHAIKEGAKYMVKTLVTDVIKEGDYVVGVKASHMGDEFEVKAKVVVAADGVDSLICKKAGINTVNHMKDYHSGYQYEMANVNCEMSRLHLFFGNEVAPKGYIWIFPKGEGIANVGIGIVATVSEDGMRARDLLDRFIENNPKYFENASPIEINGGGIPVSVCAQSFIGNGIVAVGDAAQQVNPIHGGGIGLAMNAGKIAAEIIGKAIEEGDLSKERLSEYERIWFEKDGDKMKRLSKLRGFMEKLDDSDYEKLAEILSGDDVMKVIVEGDIKYLFKIAVLKAPSMLSLGKKYLM